MVIVEIILRLYKGNSMLKKILFFLISINSVFMLHAGQAHVIVRSFNPQTNEFSILLHHPKKENTWSTFSAEIQSHETSHEAALRALTEQTHNKFGFDITPAQLREFVEDNYYVDAQKDVIYYILTTTFIKGSDLYSNPSNVNQDDYMWVPLSQLISKQPIKHARSKQDLQLAPHITPIATKMHGQLQQRASSTSSATSSPTTPESWLNIPHAIYFYHSGKPYYEFTNFAPSYPFTDCAQTRWPTSEHYFQAQKFVHYPHLAAEVFNASSAREALNIAQKNSAHVDRNWESIKVLIMLEAVRGKFHQHPSLKGMLLNTKNAVLVEDARGNDGFWGNGANGDGQNQLGQVLMRVRAELQKRIALDAPYKSNPPSYYTERLVETPLLTLQASASGSSNQASASTSNTTTSSWMLSGLVGAVRDVVNYYNG